MTKSEEWISSIMKSDILFYQFKNYCFTFAKPIEDLAVEYGAHMQIERNGQRHAGSHVNNALKSVLFDRALRREYKFGLYDICQLDVKDPNNYAVISQLIKDGVLTLSSIKDNKVYVYSIDAAEIAIKAMIKKHDFRFGRNHIVFDESFSKISVNPTSVRWKRPKKNRNVPSLLDKKTIDVANAQVGVVEEEDGGKRMTKNAMKSVLSSMSSHEQEIVRKYNNMVKFTRENGRPYIKREN